MSTHAFASARSPQRGVAFIVVLALVLLGCLALLGSTRQAWFNSKLVGAESDQQRAFAAAEALIRDAELDIQGLQANGSPCPANAAAPLCRTRSKGTGFFPLEDADLDSLETLVAGQSTRCIQGLCLPSATFKLSDELSTPARLANMQAVGATYGRFTGANAGLAGNPLLSATPPQAWYWIEVFRYSSAATIQSGTQGMAIPDPAQPYLYRIHAVVRGLKPGTQVYLRSVLVPRPMR